MRRTLSVFPLIVITVLIFASPLLADEGMWMLGDIAKLPFDTLKMMGCQLTAEEIYNPAGGGIADAAVSVSGSSGSFISPDGLIITNHHVAFSAIQRASSPEHNYLENGFYAKTKAEELQAIGYDIRILKGFDDVTKEVLASVNDKMTGRQRHDAIEKATKNIIARAEKGRDVKCSVAQFYNGAKYLLVTYFKIRDVRIVFAPPRAIGDYGGEIDNWMWPRHAGDFAVLRAYVSPDGKTADYSPDNVPYQSKAFFKISAAGINDGDFTMVIGFPGKTNRYENSSYLDDMVNFDYPRDIQTRLDVIAIMEKDAAKDSADAIKLSSPLKGLYNYLKKNQGMMDGFKKTHLLQNKKTEEKELTAFINSKPDLKAKYGTVLSSIDSLYQTHKTWREKEDVQGWMGWRCNYLRFASTIYKWAIEREKKDMDREPGYQNRDTLDEIQSLEDAQTNLVATADKEVFIYFLKRALALPAGQKIEAVENALAGKSDTEIRTFADSLYSHTNLGTIEGRLAAFHETKSRLDKSGDAFIAFARSFEKDREEIRNKDKEYSGTMDKLQAKLIAALEIWKDGRFYPDANGTIRFNYGTVKGYKPRNAVWYEWVTSLTGVMEKNTGIDPFDAPKELIEAYEEKDYGTHLLKSINDVPVDFLSTNDITNGNSGSPVLNGKGQLVGLAFDGNYEAMTSDYLFDPAITRTIAADIRYVLFLLDKVYHADGLLKEMTIQ
ncbi:Peptidase S46 [Candidatus Zixiibacteriota bacterium]|nr:Peptidase S46 [candidate division Zixibacteria bacterium]